MRHDGDRIDLEAPEVEFEDVAPLAYDLLVLALGARVNFFGVEGAADHAFPPYTLYDAVRLKDHVQGRWKAADPDPPLAADGALNVVVVGGGPTGVERAGAVASFTARLRQGLSCIPREKRASSSSTPARRCSPCSSPTPAMQEGAGEAGGRGPHRRESRAGGADARDAEVRNVIAAHTLVWGAGLQGNRLTPSLGVELQRSNASASGPD